MNVRRAFNHLRLTKRLGIFTIWKTDEVDCRHREYSIQQLPQASLLFYFGMFNLNFPTSNIRLAGVSMHAKV